MLDVGTNCESICKDPLYVGLPIERERGIKYDNVRSKTYFARQPFLALKSFSHYAKYLSYSNCANHVFLRCYPQLVDEFIKAAQDKFGNGVLLQFEVRCKTLVELVAYMGETDACVASIHF